jgi:hypothetical protein
MPYNILEIQWIYDFYAYQGLVFDINLLLE